MLSELRIKFTYANPDFYKAKSIGKWTGNLSQQVTTWTHVTSNEFGECLSLPRGGTNRVRDVFSNYNVKPRFVDQRLSLPPITNLYNDVVLRPDQERLAKVMFSRENCLIRSPTASGKTETALRVTEWILKKAGPVIIIVWEKELLEQWVERIMLRFGLRRQDVGIIGGQKKRIEPITVAMQQTLMNQGFRYAHSFGGLIADEVQRFAAPTFQKVIDIFNAKYRIGISASEQRKDKKQFLIYDAFGEVADEIEKSQLIDAGKIHDVTIRIVPTNFNYIVNMYNPNVGCVAPTEWLDIQSSMKNYNDLLDSLCFDEDRNDIIWSFIEPSLKANRTCLIITRRVAHAKYWDARIQRAGYNSGLMLGDTKNTEEFKRTKAGLIRRTIHAGIGTFQKIGTGHDIPQLDRAFIICPVARNKQLFEQTVGRLRRTCENKKDAVCYYFWDKHCFPGDQRIVQQLYPHTYMWVDKEFLPLS